MTTTGTAWRAADRFDVHLLRGKTRSLDDLLATIRIHIHDTVTRAWCTPNPLSIRKGAGRQRLSVLAELSDGTVGDVTRHPGRSWVSADPGTVDVSAPGELSGIDVTGDAPVEITATLPADLDGRVAATGPVVALDSWDNQTAETRMATLVGVPGKAVSFNRPALERACALPTT